MPRTVQIRDLDDDTYAALARRAAEANLSVPELLRQYATHIATRPSIAEWVERTRRRRSTVTTSHVLEALDESRGPWPT